MRRVRAQGGVRSRRLAILSVVFTGFKTKDGKRRAAIRVLLRAMNCIPRRGAGDFNVLFCYHPSLGKVAKLAWSSSSVGT